MPILREYATSNPVVRDALARLPLRRGNRAGDFVAPDFPVTAETVDDVVSAEHALNLDDLRAPDAEAKEVRFETGTVSTLTIVERALKTKMDSRKIEEAGDRGVDLVAERLSLLKDDIFDAKEYRISQLTFSAANYAGTHKDVTGLNFRTLDLYKTVSGWNESLMMDGRYPGNRMLIGRTAWNAARQNTGFNSFVAGPSIKAGARDLSLEKFAEYLGLEEVRVADYQRLIGNSTTPTQFWTVDSALLFSQMDTLSNRTLAATVVCPYGQYQSVAEGTLVDARTARLPGTEELTEAGAYHRYRSFLRNASLGFLATGIVNT